LSRHPNGWWCCPDLEIHFTSTNMVFR
jgi:hypothetical protein